MAEPRKRAKRPHLHDAANMHPASLLGNIAKLLHDADVVMTRHCPLDTAEPLDSESFAMGIVYATLFMVEERGTLPSSYIPTMVAIGVMK